MKIELANYLELLEFSRFGSDLDKTTKDILNHGSILMEVLKQKQYMPLSLSQEIVDIYIAQNKLIDDIPVNKIHDTLKRISEYIYSQKPEIYELLENNHLLDDDIKNKINECVLDVKKVII